MEGPPPRWAPSPRTKVEWASRASAVYINPMARSAPFGRRWLRRAMLGALPVALIGLWIAIHQVGWLGPLLADGARAIVGPTAVAKLEDWAYAVQDRINHFVHRNDAPIAYWEVPSSIVAAKSVEL